jgi:hypothetical protein
MIFRTRDNRSTLKDLALAAAFSAVVFASTAFGQETIPPNQNAAAVKTVAAGQVTGPLVDDINGIALGMTADEVKDKLGKPDTGDAATMYYDLDNGLQVQLRLDADKKVAMVAGIYSGNRADAPEFGEVFGSDVQPTRQENGSVYRRVRYPSKGYWVAYSQLDLESGPMTTVTLQKISN